MMGIHVIEVNGSVSETIVPLIMDLIRHDKEEAQAAAEGKLKRCGSCDKPEKCQTAAKKVVETADAALAAMESYIEAHNALVDVHTDPDEDKEAETEKGANKPC